MKSLRAIPLAVVLILVATSLKGQASPSFRNDIIPVLTKLGCNSGPCHGAQYGKGGFKLSLRGYDAESDYDAIAKDLKGRRVNLTNPTESLILRKPLLALPHGGGQRFKPGSAIYNQLLAWITAGVEPPRSDDRILTKLEVPASAHRMRPKESKGIQVRAHYNDSSSRDVTALSHLESLDESVAEVSQDGMIVAKGGGQTAIVIRYMGMVQVINILVPYSAVANLGSFRPANYIDELASEKWKQLGLRPAAISSDTQFLRRVFLDLIGILPREEEIREFVSSPAPDKRAKLIDQLLERPEYTDFWTLKWGDLLRVNRNGMGDKAMWSFHRWLRRNIQQNRPVDQMVQEILTSRGQPDSQEVAGFYRMAKTPEDLAETVSVTFMGVRLGCAKCHQHPFEKWSQSDYYGVAAFFARIDLKPDTDYGIATLRLKPTGFIKHPKTQRVIRPTVPDGSSYEYDRDPRIKLAEWLTSKENPWFSKNMVNRYWGYLMGRGLIEPLDDLRETNPPSIPNLLNALARDFAASGFDQKHLLRVIANSRTYQLTSEPAVGSPPSDKFYAFSIVRRLSAEQLLQAINFATHSEDNFQGVSVGTRPIELPDPEVPSEFLDIFGRSRRLVACECSRSGDVNINQVLHLMNSDYLHGKISASTGRVAALSQLVPPEDSIRNLFYATYSRPPSHQELQTANEIMKKTSSPQRRREFLEDLLWTLLNSKEFLFNH